MNVLYVSKKKQYTHPITQNETVDDFFGESAFDEGI